MFSSSFSPIKVKVLQPQANAESSIAATANSPFKKTLLATKKKTKKRDAGGNDAKSGDMAGGMSTGDGVFHDPSLTIPSIVNDLV